MEYTDWRITVFSSRGGQYFQVTEVAFLDAQGVDVSVGGAATAGSVYGGGYEAARAFDKNASTDYCSQSWAFPAWLQYQHPAAVEVKGLRIRWSYNDAWLPLNLGALEVTARSAAAVAQRYVLRLVSGDLISSTEAVFALEPWVQPKAVVFGELLTVAQAPVEASTLRVSSDLMNVRDMEFGGAGVIYGTVRDDKTKIPMQCRIRLRRSRDGLLAREVWSGSDGKYRFDGLNALYEYDVEAWDPGLNFYSVIANNQLAEVLQ